MRKPILGALALALGLSAASIAHAEQFIRVGGGLAGTYPLFAAKLVELINKNIPDVKAAVVSGETEKSQIGLEKGSINFNISYTYVTKYIYDGKASLKLPTPKVRHVITMYGSSLQTVAKKDGVTDLRELTKKPLRVWMGAKNGFFYQLAEPVMRAHGFGVDDVKSAGGVIETFGYGDTVQAFQDGRLDVSFFAGPVPYGLALQVEQSPGFHLLDMDDAALSKLEELLPGMTRTVIPAGSYKGQVKDAHVPYFVNQLTTSTNTPDEIVYQVTKIMYEQYKAFHGLFPGSEEIDDKDPLAHNLVPVHPGAERYYKEIGLM